MALPRCPRCGNFAFLETEVCVRCSADLGYHYPSLSFFEAPIEGVEIDGVHWVRCWNRSWHCNWLVSVDDPSGRCFSCRLSRREPESDDTLALEKLAETRVAVRRLLVQLFEFGLPVIPYYEKEGGLAFDLLSSRSGGRVSIGHANGVITIDLAETLDAHREALRVRLGEPYRTMLGHLRHEIGHYYQWILVASPEEQARCRALFGDERASYQDAIARHYKYGAPQDWADSFLSEYATMHPWEDFAETWAHYLHISGTLATASAAALQLDSGRSFGILDHDIVPSASYRDLGIDRMLDDWHWLSLTFNRVNRTMGQRDLYPFTLSKPVEEKLAYIHRLITGTSDLG